MVYIFLWKKRKRKPNFTLIEISFITGMRSSCIKPFFSFSSLSLFIVSLCDLPQQVPLESGSGNDPVERIQVCFMSITKIEMHFSRICTACLVHDRQFDASEWLITTRLKEKVNVHKREYNQIYKQGAYVLHPLACSESLHKAIVTNIPRFFSSP